MARNFRCKHPFSFDADGVSRVVAVDEVVSSDDPAFAQRQELFKDVSLFEPLEDYIQRRTGVEQATAVPGERRSITPAAQRGRRKADEKTTDPAAGAESKGAK